METLVVDANSTEDLDSLGEGWSVKSKSGVGYLRRVVLLSRTADEAAPGTKPKKEDFPRGVIVISSIVSSKGVPKYNYQPPHSIW